MMAVTERVLENGFWFVVVSTVLAFFWFYHRTEPRSGQSQAK